MSILSPRSFLVLAVLLAWPSGSHAQKLELQVLGTKAVIEVLGGGPQGRSMLLGQLRPIPSVRWYLGSGEHAPLITDYHWSSVAR